MEITELRKSEEASTICQFASRGVGREDGLEGKGDKIIQKGVALILLGGI